MKVLPKSDWLEEYSDEESLHILTDLAWSHINESGRFRDPLADCLRRRDWPALCNFELDYRYSDNPLHLVNARQALAFFQKWERLELPGVDKEQVAFTKFIESEKNCKRTNQALRAVRRGELSHSSLTTSVLYLARRKIAQVLGSVPSYADLFFTFGPGATASIKKKNACAAVKLSTPLSCSRELFSSVHHLLAQTPRWAMSNSHGYSDEYAKVDITVDRGRLQFVPKNAKTYRSIIVEPTLNGFAQQGVGRYLKERLLRHGVDLRSQERNQKLASAGSRTGSLSTIDLSSASDTVSLELIAELFPLDWFSLLSRFRTGSVEYKGITIELEKFSSMGNAFTFELETLVFWAISWSVLNHLRLPTGWLTVFGDDIVLPTEAAKPLVATLSELGFSVNQEKSFWDGPFRESCGTDWFLGTDIRPAYVKSAVTGESLFVLHNFYARSFDFARAKKVLKYIHPSLRIFGPDGAGDGHLVGSFQPKRFKKAIGSGWEGVYFDTYIRRPRRLKRAPNVGCVLPLYSIYVKGHESSGYDSESREYDPLVVPGSEGYRRITVYTLHRGVFLR